MAPTGCSRAATKQCVTAQHNAIGCVIKAATSRRVTRRVQHAKFQATDLDRGSGHNSLIGFVIGVDHVPQHPVGGVERNWRVGTVRKRNGGVDVIVVTVRTNDLSNPATIHGIDDRKMIVRRIQHHNFPIVPDNPNVVGDVEILTIEGEDAVGGNQFNAHPKGLSHLSPSEAQMQRAKWHRCPFSLQYVFVCSRVRKLHLHDGTQHFSAFHFVEGRFDVAETNGFADKTVEGQAALEVELDEHREVA